VVCLDGAFLFTQKEVLQKCRFDEKLFTNYHGYDIDFSLQVFFADYRVVVDNALLLQHLSSGNLNNEFYKAQKLIQKKWKKKLPVGARDIRNIKYKKYWYNTLSWITGLGKELLNNNLGLKFRKIINNRT
jgi:GT2 family glycosyltransferase